MDARGGGGGLRADRGRQYGQCDQADLDRARPRRDPLHAAMFRRRGRPACLPGRRRARHRDGDDPSARRRAQRLWHGPGRHGRAAPADAWPARDLEAVLGELEAEAAAALAAQGVEAPEIRRRAALRYDGSDRRCEVAGLGRRCARLSRRRTRRASASRAGGRGGGRNGDRRGGRGIPRDRAGAARAKAGAPAVGPVHRARWPSPERGISTIATIFAPATASPAPRSSSTRPRPPWSSPAGGPRSIAIDNLILTRAAPATPPPRWAPRSIRSCSR